MEPPTKKARTDEGEPLEVAEGAQPAAVGLISTEPVLEPEELEFDDTSTGPKVKDKATFYVEDTTMNVLSSKYNTLMPLTDGGLQYLLAGARANLGVKTGRYMFEIRVLEVMAPLEDPNARARVPQPRSQLRIGFASVKSNLFLGHSEHAIGFDNEGFLLHGKGRSQVSQKFSTGDVVAVVLNLNSASPNAHTISLFKNGKRASQPQALPEILKDKALYPILTFKNVTLHYNFGPHTMAPLPFKCRSINEVLQPDVSKKKEHTAHSEGQYEVLFPVSLPDEGGFDWLDQFLQKHPHYVELSDRSLLNWCEKSGLSRPKGYGLSARGSNDKPEMGMGIAALDDLSVRRVLYDAVAPLQQRNYVVMEVRGNLLKDERVEQLSRWNGFKRVGVVLLGEPTAAFKKYCQEVTLRVKQEVSDQDFRAKQAQEKQQFLLQKRQKQLDKEKRKAARKTQKTQEAMLKRLKYDQAKKEAEVKGEAIPDPPEEEMEEDDDEEEEIEEPEPVEQEPPPVELSDEEKKRWWSKQAVSDLTMYVVNTTFQKYSLPVKEEGFDELRYPWQKEDKVKEYLKAWVQDRKLTSRVEDLQPGEWFLARQKEWQKALAAWHAKQSSWKAGESKKQLEANQREQKRKVYEAQVLEAQKEGKEPPAKPEGLDDQSLKEPAAKIDVDLIDVFSVEDIFDLGNGEPLFANFQFEDWSMLSLRFELHLLSHAFRKDANDADRVLVPLDHLPFYYNRYFKKALSTKTYGADTVEEVARLVRDTILVTKNPISKLRVLESQLPEELECLNIFVMLTEEHRRERQRRIDLGDDAARLKFLTPGALSVPSGSLSSGSASPSGTPSAVSAAVAAASTVVRPSAVPPPAMAAMASGAASPVQIRGPLRPSFGMPGLLGLRPSLPGPVRMPPWRPW